MSHLLYHPLEGESWGGFRMVYRFNPERRCWQFWLGSGLWISSQDFGADTPADVLLSDKLRVARWADTWAEPEGDE